MKYRTLTLLTLLALLLVSIAPLAAQDDVPEDFPLTLTDALGREVTLEVPPERVVALYNEAFGYMSALNVRPVGALASRLDFYFDAVDAIPDVTGEDGSINYELVAAANPDLILTYPLEEEVPILEDIAPTFAVPAPESLDDIWRNVRTTGQLLAMEEDAEAYVAASQDRIQAYVTAVADEPRRDILPVRKWDETQWVVFGPRYLSCREVIPLFANCAAPDFEGFVTTEAILDLDPEWIILVNAQVAEAENPEAAAEAFFNELEAQDPLWNALTAVQNNRVFFSPNVRNLLLISPPEMMDFFDQMMPILYPEIFPNGPLTDEQVQAILAEAEAEAMPEATQTVSD